MLESVCLPLCDLVSYLLWAVLSSDEFAMGEYLVCVSESEYTNAGEVMCKVGKVEQKDSLARSVLISQFQESVGIISHVCAWSSL